MELGRRLRELRIRRAMSQNRVARELHVHFSTIGKYERGERQPSVPRLTRLAALYGADLSELLQDAPQVWTADEQQRMRDRPDLDRLLDAARRLSPGEVLVLTEFVRLVTSGRNARVEPATHAADPGPESPFASAGAPPPASGGQLDPRAGAAGPADAPRRPTEIITQQLRPTPKPAGRRPRRSASLTDIPTLPRKSLVTRRTAGPPRTPPGNGPTA